MTIKRLKELIKDLNEETEIYIRNTVNICGSVSELEQVEVSYLPLFGEIKEKVIILKTQFTNQPLKQTGKEKPFFVEYIETNNGFTKKQIEEFEKEKENG